MPTQAADRLAQFYGIPMTDLLDDYSRFLQSDPPSRLRQHRADMGMTRADFAQLLGTSIQSLEMWETGKRTISRKSWEKYVHIFGGEKHA